VRVRTALIAIAGVLAVVALAAVALAAPGVYDRYPRELLLTKPARRAAPAWTAECRYAKASTMADACVRLRGRVVWVQRHDPDGDGDRHLIVATRLRLHIVKLRVGFHVPVPGVGRSVLAVGWEGIGGSGHAEVDASRLTVGGRTYRRR
jgi:hypothetical protein